jgi:hypothetical protein
MGMKHLLSTAATKRPIAMAGQQITRAMSDSCAFAERFLIF